MSFHELEGTDGVYVPELRKSLQIHDVSHNSQYSVLPARDIKGPGRQKLLDASNTHTAEAHRTLVALKAISEETCTLLGVKQDTVDNFWFRLLQSEQSKNLPDDDIESFIALSYTWHSSSWKPHPSIAPLHQDAKGPLTPAMWAALLAQLQDREFFWIDQLCISQSSESEKNAAVGSMDLVYQSARKVVVALEDVALSTTDVELMVKYASTESRTAMLSENEREKFAAAFVKIVSARWFDRAWCLHEFLVGRRHVFLVPIDRPALTETSITAIIRIDGIFLGRMYYMFIEQHIKYLKTAQGSLLDNRNFTGIEFDKIRRFFNRLRAQELREVFGSEKTLEDGSFMHMFHEVFSHNALYNADKVSIILNVMNSGLYLKVPTLTNEVDCLWLIALVAMAAGDATVLTTNGPRSFWKNRQWIRVPSSGDQARRIGSLTIPRTTIDARIVREGLELHMLFLGTNIALKSPSQHYLSIARWLIDHRALCEVSIDDQEMRLDTEADETIYAKLRKSYIQALACALACGKDWMLVYYTKSYVSLPGGVDLQWDAIARERFGHAIDWGLATVIEKDIRADLKNEWQDGGTIMWADSVIQTQEADISPNAADKSYIELNQEEQVWYSMLLDFTEILVNFGLAVFPEADGSEVGEEVWDVQMCSIPEVSMFLVYAPAAGTQEQFHLAMPKALWDDSYRWMSRLWLLQENKFSTLPHQYSLNGKSRLAGIAPLPGVPGVRVTIVGDE